MECLNHCTDGCLDVLALRLGRVVDLHGEHTTRDGVERSVVEVLLTISHTSNTHLESTCVQRRTHHHQLQIASLQQQFLQQTHHDISCQRALVSLIQQNDRVTNCQSKHEYTTEKEEDHSSPRAEAYHPSCTSVLYARMFCRRIEWCNPLPDQTRRPSLQTHASPHSTQPHV